MNIEYTGELHARKDGMRKDGMVYLHRKQRQYLKGMNIQYFGLSENVNMKTIKGCSVCYGMVEWAE